MNMFIIITMRINIHRTSLFVVLRAVMISENCCKRVVIQLSLTARIHRALVEYGLTSQPTHFRSFQRWWGDCGIS